MRGTRRGVESETSSSSEAYDKGDPFQRLSRARGRASLTKSGQVPRHIVVDIRATCCPKSYRSYQILCNSLSKVVSDLEMYAVLQTTLPKKSSSISVKHAVLYSTVTHKCHS